MVYVRTEPVLAPTCHYPYSPTMEVDILDFCSSRGFVLRDISDEKVNKNNPLQKKPTQSAR